MIIYLIKFHQNDRAEDEDDGGDQKEDGIQVDPSLIPEVPKSGLEQVSTRARKLKSPGVNEDTIFFKWSRLTQ